MTRSFLFEKSFDQAETKPAPKPTPPPEPTILLREAEARIRAERQAGFDEGYAEGVSETREMLGRDIKSRIADTLETVRRELPRADEDLSEVLAGVELRATRAILSLLSHFVPRLSDVIAKGLARDLILKALSAADNVPELIIRCSPEVTPFIEAEFGEGIVGKPVTVRADESLSGAAVTVHWQYGQVSWDPADTEQEVAALLEAAAALIDGMPQSGQPSFEIH